MVKKTKPKKSDYRRRKKSSTRAARRRTNWIRTVETATLQRAPAICKTQRAHFAHYRALNSCNLYTSWSQRGPLRLRARTQTLSVCPRVIGQKATLKKIGAWNPKYA
jgi:hypothetical protein